jgi:DNA-binding IclR family transcriptional regulator
MDLPDLAALVGLTRTTTHRLLSALESEDLITKNPLTHDYRLGPAAIALGSRALRTNDVRNTARPYLESLAARTRETALSRSWWTGAC